MIDLNHSQKPAARARVKTKLKFPSKPLSLALLALALLPRLVLPAGAQSPTLGITNDTSALTVFWPVSEAGYSLWWTPAVGPASWQLYTSPLNISADESNLFVTFDSSFQATNPQAFFQLFSNPVAVASAPYVLTTSLYACAGNGRLQGTVQPNGLDTTWWFQWGPVGGSDTPTAADVVPGTSTDPVPVLITFGGFDAGTTYRCQLYGSNADGIASGGDVFLTVPPLPGAVTSGASNVTSTSAILVGQVNPVDADNLVGRFQWGTSASYGSNTPSFFDGMQNNLYATETYTLTNLQPSTTYHYRIMANTCSGNNFGADAQFTTSAPVQQAPPVAVTTSATSIGTNSATLNGTVNPKGNPNGTGYDFAYGTSAGYGSYTGTGSAGTGNSPAPVNITIYGLAAGTTYHFQLEAGNSAGSSLGGDVTFTTLGGGGQPPPFVWTQPATVFGPSDANLNGLINPNGPADAFYGFEWGTTPGYGNTMCCWDAGSGTGDTTESAGLNTLAPNTTYNYRVFAYNSSGTNYGSNVVFTTPPVPCPGVQTASAFQITTNSAGLSGLINPGGVDVDEFFQWGTNTSYGKLVGPFDAGNGQGWQSFVSVLYGLKPNTTYDYRIGAYNNLGCTNYGSNIVFTTLPFAPGALTASADNHVGTGTMTFYGLVNPNGAFTTAWFQWGTTPNLEMAPTPVGGVGNDNTFHTVSNTVTINSSASYYYRVVAQNPGGQTNGATLSQYGGAATSPAWSQFTGNGILIDSSKNAWHAGRVTDVIAQEPGAGIVVATDYGGVWAISDNDGAIPLGDDWDKPAPFIPDLQCLARGPDGGRHYFAAGSTLHETDTTQASPLFNWREIPLPSWISVVSRMAVVPAQRQIFLVGNYGGVAWSVIPPAGSPASAYSWHPIPYTSLPDGPYSSVVVGSGGAVVVGAWGPNDGNGHYGIFRGTWDGSQWNFTRSAISGGGATQMNRIQLAVCAGNPKYMYATAAASDGTLFAVLRSTDGGSSWTDTGPTVTVNGVTTNLSAVCGGQGNDRNGCIGVSQTDPENGGTERVVIGWVSGPFLSSDHGHTWTDTSSTAEPHVHADQTSIYFDPADATGRKFFLTSDGGIIMTPDFGSTYVSHYNRNLANLEFLGYTALYQWYGSISAKTLLYPASSGLNLVVAGGTQDNGNLYCAPTPSLAAWQPVPDDGGDGGLDLFLQNGDLVHYNSPGGLNNGDDRRVHWDPTSGTFSSLGDIPIQPPPSSGPNALQSPAMANVNNPAFRNAAGQLLYAIGGSGPGIYGLFSQADWSDMHWELLATLSLGPGEHTTAVGSYNGNLVYAGTIGGKLYQIAMPGGQVTTATLQLPPGPADNNDIPVILTPSSQSAFLILNNAQSASGSIYRTLDGTTWNNLPNVPPNTYFLGMAIDTATSPRTLYVTSQAHVSMSQSDGSTWSDFSAGLPKHLLCTDLRINERWLYLGTFGRSMWRVQLP